jgi:hypothetical protein
VHAQDMAHNTCSMDRPSDCQAMQMCSLAWLASSVACSVSRLRCSCGCAGSKAFATACTASDQPAIELPLAAGCASTADVEGLGSADILQGAAGRSANAARVPYWSTQVCSHRYQPLLRFTQMQRCLSTVKPDAMLASEP